jgi:hypothetical protein
MIALLFVTLLAMELPKPGDVRTLERTSRWVNRAEEIDYAIVERYTIRVLAASLEKVEIRVERQISATILEGERVPSDPADKPDTWTQSFDPRQPAVLAFSGVRDKVEARLDQMTVFWLPNAGRFRLEDVSRHEIGPVHLQADSRGALRVTEAGAQGTYKGPLPWPEIKLTVPNQLLPGSSFRGELTLESKWVFPG